jgi:hypothetical protein
VVVPAVVLEEMVAGDAGLTLTALGKEPVEVEVVAKVVALELGTAQHLARTHELSPIVWERLCRNARVDVTAWLLVLMSPVRLLVTTTLQRWSTGQQREWTKSASVEAEQQQVDPLS